MPERAYTEEEIAAALEAISDPQTFNDAEATLARVAPDLQRILAQAMGAGGWFGESHEAELLKAATQPDPDERLAAVRMLLAEEARMGMMVGAAVGWALAERLAETSEEEEQK